MNLEQQINETTQPMPTAAGQYLTFILAGTEYGVDILRVQEIKGWDTATEIPNTPEYIRGVINLRGTIVPIVDLRKRFHMEAVAYGNTTVVVVLKVKGAGGERTMGFVVDAVSDVYNVTVDQIKAAPNFGTSVSAEIVKGLAAVGDKMVILLDIDQLVYTGVAMAEQVVTH
ncbi:MAG: chemotaxis protein CheW [Gammaproteobacteria bacterium]